MVYKVSSWNKFIEIVRDGLAHRLDSGLTTVPEQVLYRGHAKTDWKLSAPLDRSLVHHVVRQGGEIEYESLRKHNGLEWYDNTCLKVLNQFKQAYRGIAGPKSNMSDDEYWAIGRHFGLLTPLLDWTLSPYVAAYFAFGERSQHMQYGYHGFTLSGNRENIRIWAMVVTSDIEVPAEFEVVRAFPAVDGGRQRAQSGLFTRLRSRDYDDVESYFAGRGLTENLVAYDISMDFAAHAMRDLQLMNITPGTLYPDLHGAAMEANIDPSKAPIFSLMFDKKLG